MIDMHATEEEIMEVTKEQEIRQCEMGRSHIVILGAGASLATFPNGDANSKILPLMNNFIDVLGIRNEVQSLNLSSSLNDFEAVYSEIDSRTDLNASKQEIEVKIHSYFDSMQMPQVATLYDLLVLSLRKKDVIATFNWDPFLLEAYFRCSTRIKSLPRLLFLHGNVRIGYCLRDSTMGINGKMCSKCGNHFVPTKLLYPVRQKNYNQEAVLANQWASLHQTLANAFMLTIFGYGAPQSDVEAIDLMKRGWGSKELREMEQTEIIDTKNADELRKTWEPFMFSHHYEIHRTFQDSWLFRHPRRSGEAYINQYLNAAIIEDNPIIDTSDLEELLDWFQPICQYET